MPLRTTLEKVGGFPPGPEGPFPPKTAPETRYQKDELRLLFVVLDTHIDKTKEIRFIVEH